MITDVVVAVWHRLICSVSTVGTICGRERLKCVHSKLFSRPILSPSKAKWDMPVIKFFTEEIIQNCRRVLLKLHTMTENTEAKCSFIVFRNSILLLFL